MSNTNSVLTAEARERVGKGSARELRRNGMVPAVIYGDKQAPVSISLSRNEITKLIFAGGFMTTTFNVEVGKDKYMVLPKDYQLDPVRDFVMHVDFLRISEKSIVTVAVPVHFINDDTCPGIKKGGVLNIVRHEVEFHCPANAIPDSITVDLGSAQLGDSIHISSVDLPKNVTPVITDRDFTIATIAAPAGLKSDEEEDTVEADEVEATAQSDDDNSDEN
ncbi:50S ribosomal protein L25/general stress protein Ctc [Martelella mediterranea]|uniref:50S ribosomal protein L25/general stress protein Ctc n=1 Tax=Martelella mediterranea TaxID=293089 RepID=UPI001E2CFCB5|nr:50S ribosomal protein L25/general stress protein Ctc [Martelella mediterranea]MCD1636771.1 50S ribosomal protein L25/general stress protein Ctc [Martelella mediterranea]